MALTWAFDDERRPETEALLDRVANGGAAVPQLWPFEVANSLLGALRRNRITQPRLAEFLAMLDSLAVEVVAEPRGQAMRRSIELGEAHQLWAYDAAYVQLAQVRALPLATLDEQMRAAARRLGVDLLP